MGRVFISYRRGDSAGHTGRLLDALERRIGRDNVFRDIEDLEPGVDFPDALDRALSQCEAMLVMIGRTWASETGAQGRRLEQSNDFVRLEVAAALARSDVRVIPVLVDGATMPSSDELPDDIQALGRRNAIELSDSRWDYDVNRLGDTLVKHLGLAEATTPASETPRGLPLGKLAKAGGIVLVLTLIVSVIIWWDRGSSGTSLATDLSSANEAAKLIGFAKTNQGKHVELTISCDGTKQAPCLGEYHDDELVLFVFSGDKCFEDSTDQDKVAECQGAALFWFKEDENSKYAYVGIGTGINNGPVGAGTFEIRGNFVARLVLTFFPQTMPHYEVFAQAPK